MKRINEESEQITTESTNCTSAVCPAEGRRTQRKTPPDKQTTRKTPEPALTNEIVQLFTHVQHHVAQILHRPPVQNQVWCGGGAHGNVYVTQILKHETPETNWIHSLNPV